MLNTAWGKRVGFAFALSAGLQGCGGDDSTGVDLSDLTGSYVATKFEFISVASPSTTFDMVADGGGSFDLTIAANGDYTMTIHFPGFPDEVDTGTITIDGNQITLHGIDPVTGTFTLSGSTLTVNASSGAEFDFDNDGTDDPAGVQLVFQRN